MSLAAACWVGLALSAGAYEVRVADGQGVPGQSNLVPALLDDAGGVAAVKVQINYDAQKLRLNSVTNSPGSLGSAYLLESDIADGVVTLLLSRDADLASGTGILVYLEFAINAGMQPGAYTELTVAEVGLGNQYGADKSWTTSVVPRGGKVWAVMSDTVDSDGDGLSDYAEQMLNGSPDYDPGRTDTDIHNPDTDGDGLPDGWEVAHSLNPLHDDANEDADGDGLSNLEEFLAGTDPANPADYFKIAACAAATNSAVFVFDWDTVTGRTYKVYSTLNWADLWTNVYQIPGDGQRKSYTNTDGDAGSRFFQLRLEQ